MKILHIAESLDEGAGRQVPILTSCDRDEVCTLGVASKRGEELRLSGVTVHALGWTRRFDPSALWNLRALLRDTRADLLHVWGRVALRAVALIAPDRLPRTVVSAPLPSRGRLSWWDRWLLRRVGCLAVAGESDRWQCGQVGLDAARVVVVPPAISRPVAGTDPQPRRIACEGPLRPESGFREAIWTMDMLNQLYPDARLTIAGSGPYRPRLEAFARDIRKTVEVTFTGDADALPGAEVCWVPSRANDGRQTALEAMARGCPVVATDVPCLREIVRDGETGILVRGGDVIGLARQTRRLFEEQGLRDRLGRAAQAYVREHCDPVRVARRWDEVYRTCAA